MLKIRNKLVFLLFSFLSLILINSCSYENTKINLGSGFGSTWTFSNSTNYEFDNNLVEIKNGRAQLKPLDLEHSGHDFSGGNHIGSYLSEDNVLSLDLNNKSISVNEILPHNATELIAYWPMNGNFDDESGRGISLSSANGTSTSSSLAFNQESAVFDGIDDELNYLGSDFLIPADSEITVSFWNYVSSSDVQSSVAFSFGSIGSDNRILVHAPWGDGNLYWDYGNGSGNGRIFTDYTPYLDKWAHIVVVSKGRGGNFKAIYIDGVLAVSDSVSDGPDINYSKVEVGYGELDFGVRYHKGQLDELAVWTKTLSQEDIEALHLHQKKNYSELSSAWTPSWESIAGYWKMDGNWQDSSRNGNHGVVSGDPVFSNNGKVGSHAGEFDGAGDIINIPGTTLDDFNTLTVSTWIKASSYSAGDVVILEKISGTYFLSKNASGKYRFNVRNNLGVSVTLDSTLDPTLDEWVHLVGTYDGNESKLYINGQLEGSAPQTGALFIHSGDLVIGCNGDISNNCISGGEFDGKIDEVAIWGNAVLSLSEIQKIYNRQKQKYAGSYESEVINLGGINSNWPDLSWSTNLPFGKGLIGDIDDDGNNEAEVISDYRSMNSDLNSGLVGYWRFNELSSGTAPGSTDFKDSSGGFLHANQVGGVVFGDEGVLHTSATFDGVDDYVLLGDTSSLLPGSGSLTLSCWIKTNRTFDTTDDNEGARCVTLYRNNSGQVLSSKVGIGIYGDDTDTAFSFVSNIGAIVKPSANVVDGNWHLLTLTYDEPTGDVLFYIDGELEVTDNGLVDSSGNETARVGAFAATRGYFEGSIDEVAVWSRALNATEVRQLYRRGANRIKFQVKSCIDPSCICESYNTGPQGDANDCDGDGVPNSTDTNDAFRSKYIGPGGDSSTYYSELFNRDSSQITFNCALNTTDLNAGVCVKDEITLAAGPQPSAPEFLYTDYSQFILPMNNQYAQYYVYMEADENTACEGKPCLPELSSVSLNPAGAPHYASTFVEVKPRSPIAFTKILSATIEAESCVSFRLSRAEVNYYFNGINWVVASTDLHRNSATDIENNIRQFASEYGAGNLEVVAYLQSDMSQNTSCSIDSIDIQYE